MCSAVVEQIYRTAFGEDYPAGAHPSAFYSATTSSKTRALPSRRTANHRAGGASSRHSPKASSLPKQK